MKMSKEILYSKLANIYDKIYSKKNYQLESNFIKKIVKKYKKNQNKKLLDVCCGTGSHDIFFSDYNIVGIDKSKEMLKIAKNKLKTAKYKIGDMKKLNLKSKFGVIICLFTSINYNKNIEELKKTLKGFHKLLDKGGIVIFDLGMNNLKNFPIIHLDKIEDKKENIIRIVKINKIKEGQVKYESLIIIINNKTKKSKSYIDTHILSIFKVKDIIKIMKKNGFKIKIYDEFKFKGGSINSKRPVFVGLVK